MQRIFSFLIFQLNMIIPTFSKILFFFGITILFFPANVGLMVAQHANEANRLLKTDFVNVLKVNEQLADKILDIHLQYAPLIENIQIRISKVGEQSEALNALVKARNYEILQLNPKIKTNLVNQVIRKNNRFKYTGIDDDEHVLINKEINEMVKTVYLPAYKKRWNIYSGNLSEEQTLRLLNKQVVNARLKRVLDSLYTELQTLKKLNRSIKVQQIQNQIKKVKKKVTTFRDSLTIWSVKFDKNILQEVQAIHATTPNYNEAVRNIIAKYTAQDIPQNLFGYTNNAVFLTTGGFLISLRPRNTYANVFLNPLKSLQNKYTSYYFNNKLLSNFDFSIEISEFNKNLNFTAIQFEYKSKDNVFINLQNYPSGIYLLRYKNAEFTFYKKIYIAKQSL